MMQDATRLLRETVKQERKALEMTQKDLSLKAGVGLRFVRELEQGKQTLRLDTINQVLFLFGYRMEPVKITSQGDK